MNDKNHDAFSEQALDDLLQKASSPPENPWFATQVKHRIHAEQTEETPISHGFPFFSWVRLALGVGGLFSIFVVMMVFFLPVPAPTTDSITTTGIPSTETFVISDDEIVSELELYIVAYQTDLWFTENSSL